MVCVLVRASVALCFAFQEGNWGTDHSLSPPDFQIPVEGIKIQRFVSHWGGGIPKHPFNQTSYSGKTAQREQRVTQFKP